MSFGSNPRHTYPDDLFADTRMSFGDHIEELRAHLLRAIVGFVLCMVIGFVLDGVGEATGLPIGLGKPVADEIIATIDRQVTYYQRDRLERFRKDFQNAPSDSPARETIALTGEADLSALKPFLPEGAPDRLPVPLRIPKGELYLLSRDGELSLGANRTVTALSAQEGFVAYVKVSLVCGLVLASPWVFYQIWSFVAAGLYPHEKKYIHFTMPFSIGLFLSGVLLCHYFVLPEAVGALLAFSEWLNVEPDIRLSEWLSFAILLPVVFGFSFQTPLFMLFFTRIGMFSAADYLSKWRYAVIIIAFISAAVTPGDVVTMLFLMVPVLGLYLLGVWLCNKFPGEKFEDPDGPGDDEFAV